MKNRKILVVDDDKLILKAFTRILRKNGYALYIAKQLGSLEKTASNRYDAMLLDIRLPEK